MKSKFSVILKKIFLSSIAGITANTTSGAIPVIENATSDLKNTDFPLLKDKDLSPKLLLKLNTGSDWTLVSHRSHRSHSSHRSHYSSTTGSSSSTSRSSSSSRSSGTTGSSSTGLGLSSSGSSSSNSGSSSSRSNTTSSGSLPGLRATALKLGDRNLKRGMSGADVTELINILLKKSYLQLEDGGTRVYGTYTYDETIEATVKRYQKDNNLTANGNCDSATAYHLLNK